MYTTGQTPETGIPTQHSADTWGVHPLNSLTLVVLDVMLFGGELVSGGLLVPLSLLVGAALILPCTLVQRAYGDSWGLALAKGILLALLTAIPSPLPSALIVALGVRGAISLRQRASRSNVIDVRN